MDVLSEVLQTVRLSGAVFFSVRTGEPFVAETPPMARIAGEVMPGCEHVIPFHVMLRGSCWVELVEGQTPPVRLEEGDVVIFPRGDGHVFLTHPGERSAPDLEYYKRSPTDQLPYPVSLNASSPVTTHFVCGYFGCDAAPFNPILEALPLMVTARRPREGGFIEVDLIHAAVHEAGLPRDGGEAVLARLSELLFVRVLRRYLAEMPERSVGLFAGLRDAHVSRALLGIHGQPARDWTLAALAQASGLSRSAFSERFSACVGCTPMQYLQRWRMQLASGMLRQSRLSIGHVAEHVGYRSEAAFVRAFKACVGTPPGAWRRGAAAKPTERLAPP